MSNIADTKEDSRHNGGHGAPGGNQGLCIGGYGEAAVLLDWEHPLLIAVSSVKDVGFNKTDSDGEEDGVEG